MNVPELKKVYLEKAVPALMKSQGYACYALSIAYQQRHSYELRSAERIASTLGVVEHRVVSLDIGQWGGSSIKIGRAHV